MKVILKTNKSSTHFSIPKYFLFPYSFQKEDKNFQQFSRLVKYSNYVKKSILTIRRQGAINLKAIKKGFLFLEDIFLKIQYTHQNLWKNGLSLR